MFELRYRGDLLGHFPSEEAAYAHAREHHGLGREGERLAHHVEDPQSLTVEPRRRFALSCRGALVDTYHSQEDAEGARDFRVTPLTPPDAWTIEEGG
jgi:hypothetical protein